VFFTIETSICCLQIDDVGGRQYTYSQLVDHVHNCAVSLRELGLRLGQRVGILLPNSIELPIAFLAVLQLGAVCVPINPAVTQCKLAYGAILAPSAYRSESDIDFSSVCLCVRMFVCFFVAETEITREVTVDP